MFLLRNTKDISIFQMKKAPYLLLCPLLLIGVLSKSKIGMANSESPDKMACYKLSHLDLLFATVSILISKAERVS